MNKHKKKRKAQANTPLLQDWWQRFEYKHTFLALASILLFVTTLDTAVVQGLLSQITQLGLVGVFLAGVMFVSFFTAAPSVVLLVHLADTQPLLKVIFVAGAGAAIGDLLIFKFFEERVGHELAPIAKKLKLTHFIASLHKRKARLQTILVGSFIIASPLPDEAGIALLGLSHISWLSLLLVTFVLNSVGLALILVAT